MYYHGIVSRQIRNISKNWITQLFSVCFFHVLFFCSTNCRTSKNTPHLVLIDAVLYIVFWYRKGSKKNPRYASLIPSASKKQIFQRHFAGGHGSKTLPVCLLYFISSPATKWHRIDEEVNIWKRVSFYSGWLSWMRLEFERKTPRRKKGQFSSLFCVYRIRESIEDEREKPKRDAKPN